MKYIIKFYDKEVHDESEEQVRAAYRYDCKTGAPPVIESVIPVPFEKCEACGIELKEGEVCNRMSPNVIVHAACYAEYVRDMEEMRGRPDDVG